MQQNTAEGAAYPTSTNTLTAVNVAMKKFTHKFQLSEEFFSRCKWRFTVYYKPNNWWANNETKCRYHYRYS